MLENKLKELRINNGLTMKELSTKLNLSESVISLYESGKRQPSYDILTKMSKLFGVTTDYLLTNEKKDSNIIEVGTMHRIPILGRIPAGVPIMAIEDIEGYEYADVKDPENHFFLRVIGDSMIGARINDGDLVLIRKEPCAENGQIVACRVNGDEMTLKRYKLKDNSIFFLPENSNYEPIILSDKDFKTGYAQIIGVAVKIHINL